MGKPSRFANLGTGATLRRWFVSALLLILVVPGGSAAETYTVRKNDTVSSIARSHGVSVNQLMEANALGRSGHIRPGQRLTIPRTPRSPRSASPPESRTSSSSSPANSALSAAFQRQLDRTRVAPGRWDYIVVHHSATAMGTARAMDRYHREQRHMENGLAYHFVIGNGNGMGDGQIFIGNRWASQINGGHLASEALNARSLGICLVGNFDRDRPTSRQMSSLDALTEYLMRRCGISRRGVKTHQQINTIGTRCPGRLFDDEAFLRGLN